MSNIYHSGAAFFPYAMVVDSAEVVDPFVHLKLENVGIDFAITKDTGTFFRTIADQSQAAWDAKHPADVDGDGPKVCPVTLDNVAPEMGAILDDLFPGVRRQA